MLQIVLILHNLYLLYFATIVPLAAGAIVLDVEAVRGWVGAVRCRRLSEE